MKRLLDSSKTLTQKLARSNSKSRRPFSREFISNERKPGKLANSVITNIKRHVSMASRLEEKDEVAMDLDVSRHNMPEKLNWYWNLDEDHKRKITDPTYVRQAVQDTFMQRAQGGYHYKKSLPSRNNFSTHTNASVSQPKPEVSAKASKTKATKADKPIPRPQVPKRKRMIDTARPMQQYLRPNTHPLSRRSKLGARLKEAGQKQLEEVKKKLYDPAPAVLDYLIDKHIPKISSLQIKGRKETSAAEKPQLPPVPSLMQRVFGWKGRDELKKNDSEISITPRSIEVKNKLAQLSEQRLRQTNEAGGTRGRSRKKRNIRNLKIISKGSTKSESSGEKKRKKTAEEADEKNARKTQAEEDREAIWSKMKPSTTEVAGTVQENVSVKKQVRDFELTPQIYPKGSLSLRKSYLPITACRPRSDIGRPTESLASGISLYSVKKEEVQETTENNKSPSITNHILDSLKNMLSKIRRNSA